MTSVWQATCNFFNDNLFDNLFNETFAKVPVLIIMIPVYRIFSIIQSNPTVFRNQPFNFYFWEEEVEEGRGEAERKVEGERRRGGRVGGVLLVRLFGTFLSCEPK